MMHCSIWSAKQSVLFLLYFYEATLGKKVTKHVSWMVKLPLPRAFGPLRNCMNEVRAGGVLCRWLNHWCQHTDDISLDKALTLLAGLQDWALLPTLKWVARSLMVLQWQWLGMSVYLSPVMVALSKMGRRCSQEGHVMLTKVWLIRVLLPNTTLISFSSCFAQNARWKIRLKTTLQAMQGTVIKSIVVGFSSGLMHFSKTNTLLQ